MAGMARRLAPAAAIAVAACGAATANIFAADGADPRRFVAADSPEARRLAPVGAIASEYVLLDKRGFGHVPPGAGTAFLVSPCYAMTNYHVLFGDQTLTPDPMSAYTLEVRFAIGDARGVPAGAADKGPMRARGRVRYAGSLDGSAPDIALVRLDGCPGRRLGWYELAAATGDDIDGVAVDQAGYSQDRGMRRLSVQHGCHIRAAAPRQEWLLHDCASRDGASGSPLMTGRRVACRASWRSTSANWRLRARSSRPSTNAGRTSRSISPRLPRCRWSPTPSPGIAQALATRSRGIRV
jgi:V8-like Glu-specific endopeptidase